MKSHKLLILLLFLYCIHQQPVHSATNSNEVGAENQTAQEIAVIKDKIPPEQTNHTEYSYHGTYNYYSNESPNWAVIVSTIATAAIALFALGQILFLKRTTDRTLKVAERAWIGVKFDKVFALNDTFVEFNIVNNGKSPGHIKQSRVIGFNTSPINEPIPWIPGPIPSEKVDTRWSIAPSETMGQRWDIENENWEIQEILNGTRRLTIYGFILYEDIFGTRHRTTFYRIWTPTQSAQEGIFIIPPETEARPGQNEAT